MSMIRTILFDLDETLYPKSTGIMDQIRILMLDYMRTKLNLTPEAADALRRKYFAAYGTTMRGLQINNHIDPDEFLRYVHNIPLERYIKPNQDLDAVLASLSQDKVVFTNASREHAENVLALLGIRTHIDRIVDVRDVNYESKPQPGAYRRICDLLGVRPEECILVEDSIRNLRPAKALGMVTVLVDGSLPDDCVDFAVQQIEEIGQVVKEIEHDE
jgi:putative hydrolase of the HAD superfamily